MAACDQMRADPVRELVEEILRTGFTLTDVLSNLVEEIPEDAFPGEEPARVLVDMVVGTVRPSARAAGLPAVRQATALVAAVRDRVLTDLRTAAELAARREAR
jgi:hypothetical protein